MVMSNRRKLLLQHTQKTYFIILVCVHFEINHTSCVSSRHWHHVCPPSWHSRGRVRINTMRSCLHMCGQCNDSLDDVTLCCSRNWVRAVIFFPQQNPPHRPAPFNSHYNYSHQNAGMIYWGKYPTRQGFNYYGAVNIVELRNSLPSLAFCLKQQTGGETVISLYTSSRNISGAGMIYCVVLGLLFQAFNLVLLGVFEVQCWLFQISPSASWYFTCYPLQTRLQVVQYKHLRPIGHIRNRLHKKWMDGSVGRYTSKPIYWSSPTF